MPMIEFFVGASHGLAQNWDKSHCGQVADLPLRQSLA